MSANELEQYADITITDANEASDQISQAEEIIDSYVGFQEKFFRGKIKGRSALAGGNGFIYLQSDQQNVYQDDYFKGMEIEILGGTGEGERRRITASDYQTGKITVSSNWTTAPDITSFYVIYQLGKFPRGQDVVYYSNTSPYVYYKSIPEVIKRAVASQVEYMVQMGDDFFRSDKVSKQSEHISRYSYTNAKGEAPIHKLIAPKAKMLLKSIRNRTGQIV